MRCHFPSSQGIQLGSFQKIQAVSQEFAFESPLSCVKLKSAYEPYIEGAVGMDFFEMLISVGLLSEFPLQS